MKLLRFGPPGQEKPGILDGNGKIRSLENVIQDIALDALSHSTLAKIGRIDPYTLPEIEDGIRIGSCVGQVGKLLGIGLNYRDHAKETNSPTPKEPIVFSKVTSAICGPYDTILIPRHSEKTDWEAELGVVIGTAAKYVSKDEALNHVAGYCVINDISERAFQLEGTGQWIKGKSCDTFAPIGPWLVTADEIGNPQNLDIWLEVDGKRFQNSNTREMVFSVAELVSYLSQFFTLYPGDIITTGTPSGVGLGQKPDPIFLKPNQTIRLGISGLGEQLLKTAREK